MGEDFTGIVSFGVPMHRVWELLVTRVMPGHHVEFDGHSIGIGASEKTALRILAIRPVGPDATEISLWGPPGNGLLEALIAEPGSAHFIQRDVSRGVDWESRRLVRGGQTLLSFGVGPDGDRSVEIDGETVFARADRWDDAGAPDPDNHANEQAYRRAALEALDLVAARLGEAAIVLADYRERARGRSGRGEIPWPEEVSSASDDATAPGSWLEDDDIPF